MGLGGDTQAAGNSSKAETEPPFQRRYKQKGKGWSNGGQGCWRGSVKRWEVILTCHSLFPAAGAQHLAQPVWETLWIRLDQHPPRLHPGEKGIPTAIAPPLPMHIHTYTHTWNGLGWKRPQSSSRDTFHHPRLLQAQSNLALGASRAGAATASLENLCQGLTPS